jgi:amidohydrolase
MRLRLARAFAASLTLAVCIPIAPRAQQRPPDAAARERAVASAAESMRARLVEQRRDFHMHPELSNREERTARVVAERLRALGFDDVRTGVGKHGVVGVLKGGRPGPVVAVRADMDALPIDETSDVPYKSQNPGVKHACGHDAHTTIELGVAEILAGMRSQIPGTVKFLFQPAEEGPPAGEEGGARLMIKEGALENPRPAAIFGLHVMPAYKVGEIAYTSGPAMASSDRFVVTVRGKRAHGAAPHLGVDTVLVAAECVTALQTIRSRRIDPQEPIVLTVGSVHGGNRFNILADEVKLEGTVRTLNEDVRKRVQEMMRTTLAGVTSAYGASYEMEYEENTAVTVNDPGLVGETLPAIGRSVGEANLRSIKAQMVAEDFSYYQRVVPGFFYFLGVANESKGITASLHTAEFDLDEESLVIGVRTMTTVVLDYLERHSQHPAR